MTSPGNETYRGEAMLLRWSESADSGMTVTLKLDDGPDGYKTHPCKGLPTGKAHGQRFAMMLVPLGDDEKPAVGIPATEPSPRAAEPKRWDSLKPSQQMGIACNDPVFREWLDIETAGGVSLRGIESAVRMALGVVSRAQADTDTEIAARWHDMYDQFLNDTRLPEQR